MIRSAANHHRILKCLESGHPEFWSSIEYQSVPLFCFYYGIVSFFGTYLVVSRPGAYYSSVTKHNAFCL